ncbi:CapA family protein [Breznakiellaceae bacterium SP9]
MNRAFVKLGIILSLLSLACCIIFQNEQVRGIEADAPADLQSPALQSLTLVAVGDTIFHDEVLWPQGKKAAQEGDFDFTGYYEAIKPLIEKADIAFVNQETVFAGPERGYSGYPNFNTPREAGLALIDAGFDVVNLATNHVLDWGEQGLLSTIEFWEDKPAVTFLGIHKSIEARSKHKIIEKNGIKVGFLSYCYGFNGYTIPKGKDYLISVIDRTRMKEEITRLRPLCDFLIVSMHWGLEYDFEPSPEQESLAEFLSSLSVDLIIGHHPHVLQPVKHIARPDGGTLVCAFSLGNFLATQKSNPASTILGGLLYVKLTREEKNEENEENTAIVDTVGLLPLLIHYDKKYQNLKVYPFSEYTNELMQTHRVLVQNKALSRAYYKDLAQKILGGSLLEALP